MKQYKILYQLKGRQILESFDPWTELTKEAVILWDERLNGPLPAAEDHTIVDVIDGQLVENSEKKAAKEAEKAAEDSKKATFDAAWAKVENDTATVADLRKVIRHF